MRRSARGWMAAAKVLTALTFVVGVYLVMLLVDIHDKHGQLHTQQVRSMALTPFFWLPCSAFIDLGFILGG